MTTPVAVVAGAGLGGLAAGLALSGAGWQVLVCERGELEPAGAGISLWPNALRCLDRLGVGEQVRRAAVPVREGLVRRPDGRLIARTRIPGVVEERFGDPLVVLSRAEMIAVLAARLPAGALRTGVTARVTVSGSARQPALVDVGGDVVRAGLVVAADGAGSPTRQAMFPGHPGPGYAGYTTWRFITTAPGAAAEETWGPGGRRFGIVPMAAGRVYCYATSDAPQNARAGDELAELRRRFGGWHDPIPALLDGLTAGQVLRHDIVELVIPVPAFHSGRVALLGDAAHAMTPELGQGAGQALEDAVTLAAVATAAREAAIPGCLARYTELRLPRTRLLARRSRSAGRVSQASGRLALAARGWGARAAAAVPPGLAVRGLAGLVEWTPPSCEDPGEE